MRIGEVCTDWRLELLGERFSFQGLKGLGFTVQGPLVFGLTVAVRRL